MRLGAQVATNDRALIDLADTTASLAGGRTAADRLASGHDSREACWQDGRGGLADAA
jgi:hypothetical protein